MLVDDMPGDVAEAFLDVLLTKGFLVEANGHVGVATKPDVTLMFPADAGPALRRAVSDWADAHSLDLLLHCIRGSGAAGSGMGLPVDSTKSASVLASADALARWHWNTDVMIRALAVSQATSMMLFDFVSERMTNGLPSPATTGSRTQSLDEHTLVVDLTRNIATWQGREYNLRGAIRGRLFDVLGKNGPEFVSGERLAERCGVSDVDQVVRGLRRTMKPLGDLVDSSRRGYRLKPGITVRRTKA